MKDTEQIALVKVCFSGRKIFNEREATRRTQNYLAGGRRGSASEARQTGNLTTKGKEEETDTLPTSHHARVPACELFATLCRVHFLARFACRITRPIYRIMSGYPREAHSGDSSVAFRKNLILEFCHLPIKLDPLTTKMTSIS